ncbi:MAG: helix-turn-helix transcriptional regulator [Paracoccus sp. (in: a-proteobacteria)]|uniref:helix-turn-helix transcriptional regulator n=1 Tax=Paracoccus sp. TaxID=267 RepID=UPI00391CA695
MDQKTIDAIAEAVAERLLRELPRGRLPMTPEYLTADQVAQMTGFSTKSLEAYRAKRQGPPFLKIGHSIRYRADDVRAWVEAGE